MLMVTHPPGYTAEREYALRLVLGELLSLSYTSVVVPGDSVTISVPGDTSGRRVRVTDGLFRTAPAAWLTAASLPTSPVPWIRVPDFLSGERAYAEEVPVLYGPQGRAAALRRQDHEIVMDLDVFGGSFFSATRYEEIVLSATDRHGRFPATASLAYREGFLDLPVVNMYAELLWACLRWLWPTLERPRRTYKVVVTHDVDRPFCVVGRPARRVIRDIGADVKRGDFALAWSRTRSAVMTRSRAAPSDPCYATFDFLMDQSERLNCTSAFFFIAGDPSHPLDPSYSIEDAAIRRLIARIASRGHEIGLHARYDSYLSPQPIREDFERLQHVAAEAGVQQDAWGGRQHYLRWRNPDTWQAWEDASLQYDSTVGFADHVGFRGGVCCEYPVFNLRRGTPLALRERPLVAMDATLCGYMGLGVDRAIECVRELAATCRSYSGELCILAHNDRFLSSSARRAYVEALAAIGAGG
jgi:hypothetical protein